MQVNYNNGAEELIRMDSLEQFKKKLEEPEVQKITVHKPGSIITLQSGAQYRVADDGSWRRI